MSTPQQSTIGNRILSLLPQREFDEVAAHLLAVDTPRGFLMVAANGPIEYVYFPCSGIGSVITVSPEGNQAEGGLFGRDGFAPISAAVGADRSLSEVSVQVPGHAYRLTRSRFLQLMDDNREFSKLLHRAAQVLATQVSFTALSNAVHEISERLARWILMCHDRVDGDQIALTHEFIAIMLAVRRPSVTTALHVLEGNGFIRSERGNIIVRNRRALEEFAADAYGKPEEEYLRLIGPLR